MDEKTFFALRRTAAEAVKGMDEKTFLQQLFLLASDMGSCPELTPFVVMQRNGWLARLRDLLNRRVETRDKDLSFADMMENISDHPTGVKDYLGYEVLHYTHHLKYWQSKPDSHPAKESVVVQLQCFLIVLESLQQKLGVLDIAECHPTLEDVRWYCSCRVEHKGIGACDTCGMSLSADK